MFNSNSQLENAANIDAIVERENISHLAKIAFVCAVGCAVYTGLNAWHYKTVCGELPGRTITTQTITRGYMQDRHKLPDLYYQCYMSGGEKCVAVDYRIGQLPKGAKLNVIEARGDFYHISDPEIGKRLNMNLFHFWVTLLIAAFSLIKSIFPRFLNLKNFISPPTTKLFDE